MSHFCTLTAREIGSLLRGVAELRVQGKDWEAIAAAVKMAVGEMRRILDENEAAFLLQMKKARLAQRQFCFDSAYEKLRQQTLSSNEKISHSASSILSRLKMAEDRLRAKKEQARLRLKSLHQTPNKSQAPPPPKQNTPTLEQLATDAIKHNEQVRIPGCPSIDERVKQKLADEGLFVDVQGANNLRIRKV